jgi:phosphoglycolate phosphatase-like HAD superfamily hydrolase
VHIGGQRAERSGARDQAAVVGHLVWDWNGTLLDDLDLVVTATNASLATFDGPVITADDHRRDFRRPLPEYYSFVLGRTLDADEYLRLDRAFHTAYRAGLPSCGLAPDALDAIRAWRGTQSLLSMWFHDELLAEVTRRGLVSLLGRIDGLRSAVGGDRKAGYLAEHLAALGVEGADCVLIGDSVDDAHAAEAVGAGCVLYGGGITDPDKLAATGRPVARTLVEAVGLASAALGAPCDTYRQPI